MELNIFLLNLLVSRVTVTFGVWSVENNLKLRALQESNKLCAGAFLSLFDVDYNCHVVLVTTKMATSCNLDFSVAETLN